MPGITFEPKLNTAALSIEARGLTRKYGDLVAVGYSFVRAGRGIRDVQPPRVPMEHARQ